MKFYKHKLDSYPATQISDKEALVMRPDSDKH